MRVRPKAKAGRPGRPFGGEEFRRAGRVPDVGRDLGVSRRQQRELEELAFRGRNGCRPDQRRKPAITVVAGAEPEQADLAPGNEGLQRVSGDAGGGVATVRSLDAGKAEFAAIRQPDGAAIDRGLDAGGADGRGRAMQPIVSPRAAGNHPGQDGDNSNSVVQ